MLPLLPFLDDGFRDISLSQDFCEGQNAVFIKQPLSNGLCPSTPDRDPTFSGTFSLDNGAYLLSLTPKNSALTALFEQVMPLINKDFEGAPADYSIPLGASRLVTRALNRPVPDEGKDPLWIAIDGLFPLPMRTAHDFTEARLTAVRKGGGVTFEYRRRMNSVTDGTSKTLMVIEDAGRPQTWKFGVRDPQREPNFGSAWCDPSSGIILDGPDKPLEGLVQGSNRCGLYSFHSRGVNVGFADGHVSTIAEDIDPGVLVSLLTPDGRDNKADSEP